MLTRAGSPGSAGTRCRLGWPWATAPYGSASASPARADQLSSEFPGQESARSRTRLIASGRAMPRPTAIPIRYEVTGAAGRSTLCATSLVMSRIVLVSAGLGATPRSSATAMTHRSIALLMDPTLSDHRHPPIGGCRPARPDDAGPGAGWHDQMGGDHGPGGRSMAAAAEP